MYREKGNKAAEYLDILKQYGFTDASIAKALGINRVSVNRILNGARGTSNYITQQLLIMVQNVRQHEFNVTMQSTLQPTVQSTHNLPVQSNPQPIVPSRHLTCVICQQFIKVSNWQELNINGEIVDMHKSPCYQHYLQQRNQRK